MKLIAFPKSPPLPPPAPPPPPPLHRIVKPASRLSSLPIAYFVTCKQYLVIETNHLLKLSAIANNY